MTDWSVLENPVVTEMVETVVRVMARKFYGVMEADDFRQEAYIAVATNAPKYRAYLEDDTPGLFYHALWSDLVDVGRREGRYSKRTVALEDVTFIEGEADVLRVSG
jgi:hypothetical protein